MNNDLKLFVVTKTESGYSWSSVAWVRYFMCNDIAVLRAVIQDRYGHLHQYHYDEEESHITIEEAPVETVYCKETT